MADLPDEKKFMREKIVKPQASKRQMANRIICLFITAVIFGIVAAVSFVVSRPVVEKYLGRETKAPTIPITIERDDEPHTTAPVSEPAESTAPSETYTAPDRQEVEKIVQKELETFSWTEEKIDGMNQVIQEIGRSADKSIVTVSSIRHQVDWFDNPVESTGQFAGIILAVNPSEVAILTGTAAVEEADSLRVVFGDGSTASGTVKQKDNLGGLAVISVAAGELSEATRDWITAVELGNSYSVQAGDIIIAVGSPAGIVHSVKRGAVSYVAGNVQIPDGMTRILYADFDCETEKGIFFLNLSGELVGWVADLYDAGTKEGATIALPISEYKGCLQKLSNGIPIPYMGIKGQDVSEAMSSEGIPEGLYITESIADSPAYMAGIQNGDILTKIQGVDIASIRDYQNCLEALGAGAEVKVVVQRKGIDEYKEIEYNVIIGAR